MVTQMLNWYRNSYGNDGDDEVASTDCGGGSAADLVSLFFVSFKRKTKQ